MTPITQTEAENAMSDIDCFCDYEPATFYHLTMVRAARKQHKCTECSRPIRPGESYERVRAMWEGDISICRTCNRCLALRGYVKAHVPCFCWAHHNMIEDAIGTAEHYASEGPGLLFGALRRKVLIERNRA